LTATTRKSCGKKWFLKKLVCAFGIAAVWLLISGVTAFAAAKPDGSNTYGYDWVSQSDLSTSDAIAVKMLYSRFADYAKDVMNYDGDLKPDSQGDYYLREINVSDLNLTVNLTGSGRNRSAGEGEMTNRSNRLLDITSEIFMDDNTQYYMFNGYFYWYSYSGGGSSAKIEAVTLSVYPEYAKASVRQANQAVIDAKFSEYARLVSSVSSDYDKVRLVHDKMLAERDYADANGVADRNAYAHNILGVMDTSTPGPVCESYTKAFAYVLNRLGIETLILTGSTPEGIDAGAAHTWNVVKVDGKWYYCDLTFDELDTQDQSSGGYDPGNQMNGLIYKYFLIGASNHTMGNNEDLTFSQLHVQASTAGLNIGGTLFYSYSPPAISTNDYDLINGSQYIYLTDNGLLDEDYGLPAIHPYLIAKSAVMTSETPNSKDGNPVLFNVKKNSYTYNYGPYIFGTFTEGETPIITLYKWDYYPNNTYLDESLHDGGYQQLVQGRDYTVQVEQPVKNGLNRCWIYGIGNYRGIDFVMVNMIASNNPPAPSVTQTPAPQNPAPEAQTPPAQEALTADITLNGVRLYINNVMVTDSDTLLYNDTLWFPISLAAKYLGYSADYDGAQQITNLTYTGVQAAPPEGDPRQTAVISGASLAINAIRLYINGAPADGINTLTYNDRLYVPINAVANRLGFNANYDGGSNATYISK